MVVEVTLCVVWVVPVFKEWVGPSETWVCSLTHGHWWAQRGSVPINRARLIQPQPSSLPSCLCLREDTTAVTQTVVYPLLSAVVKGIIHMLPCQSPQEREGFGKKAPQKKKWSDEIQTPICACVSSLYNLMLICCFCLFPLCSLSSCIGTLCNIQIIGANTFPEQLCMVLIVHVIDSTQCSVRDAEGNWGCLAKCREGKSQIQ